MFCQYCLNVRNLYVYGTLVDMKCFRKISRHTHGLLSLCHGAKQNQQFSFPVFRTHLHHSCQSSRVGVQTVQQDEQTIPLAPLSTSELRPPSVMLAWWQERWCHLWTCLMEHWRAGNDIKLCHSSRKWPALQSKTMFTLAVGRVKQEFCPFLATVVEGLCFICFWCLR